MVHVLVVLFWVSLLLGTLLAHNIVANWAVALGGLYLSARWWARRSHAAGSMATPASADTPARGTNSPAAPGATSSRSPSWWTVDRVHVADRHWR
jgi:hypothetical protein